VIVVTHSYGNTREQMAARERMAARLRAASAAVEAASGPAVGAPVPPPVDELDEPREAAERITDGG
jgi:hypothetical protein